LAASGVAALGARVDGRGLEVFRNVMQNGASHGSLPRFAAFGQLSLAAVFNFALVNNDMKGQAPRWDDLQLHAACATRPLLQGSH
jgi:hypothetical protein